MTRSSRGSIFHLITGIDVGGAENHLLDLCHGLVDRGWDVTVGYLKGDGELAGEFRAVGCRVERIGIRADIDPVGFARLLRTLRKESYDILHAHLFHANVYGIPAARLVGIDTVVVTKHNDERFWERWHIGAVHDALLGRVDAVVTISDHVQSHLLELTTVDPNLVTTVHYGFDPAPFDAVDTADARQTRREFAADDDPLIGTVARLTEQKDLATLLRAFDQVLETHHTAHLAIVGRGEREGDLKRLAARRGIDDCVTFAGFRRDVPELMHAFDVFALPSRWEGFGVVFMEAMAAETPIVASNTSAIPEVVADGTTGFLFPPGDATALADHLSHLLAEPDTATELGTAGRERLETRFGIERMVDETVAVYGDALR